MEGDTKPNELAELADRLTVAGFQEAYGGKSTKCEADMFRIGLILALGAIVYQSYVLAQKYTQEGGMFYEEDTVGQQGPFPNVTVCGPELIKRDMLRKLILQHFDIFENIFGNYSNITLMEILEDMIEAVSFTVRVKNGLKHKREIFKAINILSDRLNLSVLKAHETAYPTCSEVFSHCQFETIQFNCCNATELMLFDERVCYHFSLSQLTTARGGPSPDAVHMSSSGLSMHANIVDWSNVVFWDDVASDGFDIFLGPLPSPWSSPIAIPSDMDAIIALAAPIKITEMSNCIRENRLPPMHFARYYDADAVGCVGENLANELLKNYGCVPPGLNFVPEEKSVVCNVEQLNGLGTIFNGEVFKVGTVKWKAARHEKSETLLRDIGRQAFGKCHPYCTRYQYRAISASYNAIHSQQDNATWDTVNNSDSSWSQIRIFFPTASYHTKVETQLAPVYMAVCDIGGTMGVYAGLSMITVVQILVYPILLCLFLKKKRNAIGLAADDSSDEE